MKKTIITAIMLSTSFLSAFASSNDDDVKIPYAPEIGSVSYVSEQVTSLTKYTSLTRLKERANQLIRERITALESNKRIIENNKALTSEQKVSLGGTLTTNISALTSLKVAIASSTDATSTRKLVSSITTDYRIFGIVIPKVRLEKRIYDLQSHSTKLSDAFLKVQTKIDEQKAKGKDVTVWQKSLEDAKLLVATDMGTLAVLLPKVTALKPSDYGTTSKMIIESANNDLKKVAKDFNSIVRTIRKPSNLKKVEDRKNWEHSTSTTATSTR